MNDKVDNSGPAFPASEAHGCNSGVPGMSMRDYFAAHAPAAPASFFARYQGFHNSSDVETEAAWRWKYADKMVKARNR